jgi:hypothetical protein
LYTRNARCLLIEETMIKYEVAIVPSACGEAV